MDLKTVAGTAEVVVQKIEEFEPTAATMASMFIPDAAPIVAMVQPWAPLVLGFAERALDDIAKGNGGDLPAAMIDFLNHVSAGKPNASALAPTPAVTP
jgi:hypothetical protein